MDIPTLKANIVQTADSFLVIKSIHIIDETDNAIKLRLVIDPSLFVNIYHHVVTGTVNYVLVYNSQRIYGLDCYNDEWHRHPFENPNEHEPLPTIDDQNILHTFLTDVEQYIVETGLI